MRGSDGLGDQGQEPEDFLLERLQEAASGDTGVRQLRRRYELLRQDYERLIDRLGELEDRLDEAATAAKPPPPPSPVSESIAEAIAAPLLKLRDDYLAAVAGIQGVVSGLEGLASGFKGQHAASGEQAPAHAEPADASGRIRRLQVDVKGSGFGELLDFQERLSQLAGVSRVSISAIVNERATVVVELEHPLTRD
jgi:hypothetical protein